MISSILLSGLPMLVFFSGWASSATTDQYMWPPSEAGQVHGPSWLQFANATTRWSTYAAPTINEVFIPQSEDDLSAGLRYLSSSNKTWLAKSGGHGYSVTLRTIQNATLIDMENFAYVNMNADMSVTVGTGTTFDDFINVLGGSGREITVGFCSSVGVVGATIGGGLGRLEGLHGLTSDALTRVRMALWNGTIVEASDAVNQDLFWGVRGAGQNFGIIIEVTFETYPATNGGMQYSSDLTFTVDKLEAVFNVTNILLEPELDPKLAIATSISPDPTTLEPGLRLNIVYHGPLENGQEFRKLYSPFSSGFTEQMTTWTNLTSVAFPDIVAGALINGNPHNQYSVLTRNLPIESLREAVTSLGSFAKQYPTANESTIFIETFGQKGVEALPREYSAFPHRNSFRNAIVFSMTYPNNATEVADAADSWALGMRNKFAQPDVSGYDRLQIYQNYAHGDEPLSALYGYEEWRHERLTKLKNTYDPHGFFNGYHAIPSNLADWS
ncbi:uncharacterized protein GGS22DRAFT_195620 [Annulohypoxylon maeteangense]|uniref:uncharacterized protein n=1 Tax=Annulohypoxylon maeteangense TaxID=1927788 RepID=UPI0020077C69|nr:uncharacterized protein GGS22DRAFT_195620 [Annulohypoxylon maeteangense]KAI0882904.1 hypothetical protein GGS22DRAFT_195620 [Annulohypoxylon maeteangense]